MSNEQPELDYGLLGQVMLNEQYEILRSVLERSKKSLGVNAMVECIICHLLFHNASDYRRLSHTPDCYIPWVYAIVHKYRKAIKLFPIRIELVRAGNYDNPYDVELGEEGTDG